MPFLLTTTIMMNAVKKGIGREDAHEIIKEHAVATSNDLRSGAIAANDLLKRLADDPRMPLTMEDLRAILETGGKATGLAVDQTEDFVKRSYALADKFPKAKEYVPAPIL